MPEPDQLLTTAEVARMLRTPESTLRYWRHKHVGPPSFRARRHVLYWRSDVLAWLAAQQAADRNRTAS
jgi:DNA-binding transcriptional MerR regulator